MGGIGNIGWVQLLILLLIVLLIFGTKRVRHLGRDLGGAIRDFRKGVGEGDEDLGTVRDDSADTDAGDKKD